MGRHPGNKLDCHSSSLRSRGINWNWHWSSKDSTDVLILWSRRDKNWVIPLWNRQAVSPYSLYRAFEENEKKSYIGTAALDEIICSYWLRWYEMTAIIVCGIPIYNMWSKWRRNVYKQRHFPPYFKMRMFHAKLSRVELDVVINGLPPISAPFGIKHLLSVFFWDQNVWINSV